MKRALASARAADWHGVMQLTQDAVLGLTDLVEALHRQIAHPLLRRPAPLTPGAPGEPARTRGLTGMVYRTVRGVTRGVGSGADALLAALMAELPPAGPKPPSAEREAVIAALNGVLGDHLAARRNPLAIAMSFRHRGVALRLQPASLAAALRNAGPRPLVLIHGLCMNDLQWGGRRDDAPQADPAAASSWAAPHDHGAALARDLGHTPIYLHYNTGRSIADNGLELSQQMEALVDAWPVAIRELNLLTHSMGGLVARSALEQGRRAGHRWVQRVDRLVFLGTPHHGAPLERGGHWIERLLGVSRYSAPFVRLARLRSAGITDLRHGRLLPPEPGAGGRPPHAAADHPIGPLPASVAAFTLASTLGAADPRASRLLGDGLVPVASALGQHADPRRALIFAPDRQCVIAGVGHLQLLSDPAVYRQLRRWLAQPLPIKPS